MFSARLFLAVAGVLLISNTAQAKADERPATNITIYIEAANQANNKALKRIKCVNEEQHEAVKTVLLDAKEDFSLLLSGKATEVKDTLQNALILETKARDLIKNHLKSDKGCKKLPKNIGSAIKNIEKAINHTVTEA